MRLLFLLLIFTVRALAAPGQDFTLVALPDTQKYARFHPEIFQAQVDWIIAQRANLNIVYVAHLGDITDNGDEVPAQWEVAGNCLYRLLDPQLTGLPHGIPFGVVPGNHDHLVGETLYDKYFGPDHFEGKPWYGGHPGADNRNHYDLLQAGGLDFLILYIDFNRDKIDYQAADAWAGSVLKANSHKRAILVSHDILTVQAEYDPRGLEIYENLKDNPNLFLALCGHNHGEAKRSDTFNNRTIYSCLSDYQSCPNGGDGYLRLYRFSPATNVIHVQTYSPTLDHYRTDQTAQFDIPYRMNPDAPMPDLPPFENIGMDLQPGPANSPVPPLGHFETNP